MSREFEGKTAIVTGGASGIGAAIVRQLARGGAAVIVADLDLEAATTLAGEIAREGGTAHAFEIDVADPAASEALVAFAEEKTGALHLAVNNAGIGGPSAPVGEYPVEDWDKVIAVNLSGVFYGMRCQLPAIEHAGGGAIVNMASILGSVAFEGAPAYTAAKHGLLGLTREASLTYAARNIRVNAVGPGFIETPLLSKNLDDATIAQLASLHPAGRLGTSEEVSELTCFLLSERASFIHGSYHLVDGGYTAR